jgi:Type II secretion system (T2SS), protein E, N-terminal domain
MDTEPRQGVLTTAWSSEMTRLGDLLVSQGLLTPAQRDQVVRAQKRCGRPFGVLAEETFGLSARQIERAWVEQFAAITERVVPLREEVDKAARAMVNRRQAWQFRLVPLRMDGGELVLATTPGQVARTLRFAERSLQARCVIVLTEEGDLLDALEKWYPMAGARDCLESVA